MRLQASEALVGPDLARQADVALELEGGRIARLSPGTAAPDRRLILPAFVNAHDHARPLPMSSFGTAFLPLEAWLPRTVLATPPDPYLAALAPLGRAALSGCAAVMVHYTRPSGLYPAVEEAREVARAARDIGLRIAFAPALRDINPLAYGDQRPVLDALSPEARRVVEQVFMPPPRTVAEMIETTEAIAEAIGGPMVDVQFGPAGVQWCSPALLEAVAERSAATGRRVHMHLLETVYQRRFADATYPQGILRYLADIGLLSERLALVHCVHARPDELDLIAEAGATIVVNTSSNLGLRSGVGPIAEALRRGCKVAIGMDGATLDEDDDMLREMRLTHHMHAGSGFAQGWRPASALRRFVSEGRRVVGAPGDGALAEGAAADLVCVDLERLDRDAILPVAPLDLLFSRGTAAHVEALHVAGRAVVTDGRLTGIDLPAAEAELRAMFRQSVQRFAAVETHWPALESALRDAFGPAEGCCG